MTGLARPRLFESPQARRQFVVHVLLLVTVLALLLIALRRQVPVLFDPREARAFVAGFGLLAPAVLIVLQAIQVVLAPVPGHVLAAAAGYLFGPWWGTLYNVIGIILGSTVAFALARRFGRSYVERIAHSEAIEWFDGIDDRHKLATLFLFFLFPGLPDDALCFLGGLTQIPLWKLVAVAAVGRAPAFFLVNVFGGYVGTGDAPAAIVVALVFIGLSLVGFLLRDRIFDAINRGG